MTTLFEGYRHLYPPAHQQTLSDLFKRVHCRVLDGDVTQLEKPQNPHSEILIVRDLSVREMMHAFSLGYEHVIQEKRGDFAQELLASALMISRPVAFTKNPIPFFLSHQRIQPAASEPHLIEMIQKTSDKPIVLDALAFFISQLPRLASLSDLIIQTADEMITNALFGAPVDRFGDHMYIMRPRTSHISISPPSSIQLFASFNERRFLLGCQDSFGSLNVVPILRRLNDLYGVEQAQALANRPGAGLGFKFMIDNSANFYLLSEQKKSTLIACGFLLNGLRANLSSEKHIHIGVR